ncbi:MAG: hypothetical protein ACE5F7_07265 [Nitrospiria bacterium]
MMLETESDPMDEGDAAAYDKAEVQSAKEVAQILTKTAKTLKIYLPNNPIHQKFITSLFEKLTAHLQEYGPIRLRIKQFELLCTGQPVYENMNRLESIAFRLFVDGLREISFHPGLEKDELIAFLKVLGQEGSEEEDGQNRESGADDDIVTLLWEKHFAHIEYIVVDDLRGDQDELEACKEMNPAPPKPRQLNAVYNQEAMADPAKLSPKGVEIPALHIFKLTEDEVRAIRRELRWEEEIDIVKELEGMLFDILRIETETGRFVEVLEIIDHIFEELAFRGDFVHARKILEFYWEMLDPDQDRDPHLTGLVKKALLQAGNPKRIAALDVVLNRLSSEQLDEFLPFMVLFQKEIIPSVIDLFDTVQSMKTRRLLCDILAELGQMDVQSIIARLNDKRWFVVRNLIYVLGKIGDTQTISVLSKFIHHEEIKIRKEVLHVLDAMKHKDAFEMMLQFISDPDLSNRVYAIKSLVKNKVAGGLPPLLHLIASKEFETKALYEKKEIFNGAAKLGGDDVIPEMVKHLDVRWSLFKNIPADERAICAAVALQRIGSPSAIEALREGERSRNKTVRDACKKSLTLLGVDGS